MDPFQIATDWKAVFYKKYSDNKFQAVRRFWREEFCVNYQGPVAVKFTFHTRKSQTNVVLIKNYINFYK